jgi:diguanylate cyclase (GGDEF)-like protein
MIGPSGRPRNHPTLGALGALLARPRDNLPRVSGEGIEARGGAPRVPVSRMYSVVRYVTYVGISAHALFIGVFAWLGLPIMAAFNVYSVASWVAARIANERRYPGVAALLLFVEVVSHAVLACHLLGWNSGFHYYLIPIVPFLMFHDRLSTRTAVLGSVIVTATYLLLRAATIDVVPTSVAPGALRVVDYGNIAIPLVALGVISIYFRFASIEVERHMESLAMTDALTKLPNRRRMRELLEAERVRCARDGHPFGVVVGDIDAFKLINDTRGHDCGDHVLGEVAAALRGVLRAQDSVARWGGEEFLFLLPDTDLRGAGVVAEKLRGALEATRITFAERRVPVAMTFGVAVCVRGATVEDAISRADRALYSGKHAGKNQVVLESGDALPMAALS